MSLTISRILHAGYVFESGPTVIAFDPIFENPFSRNCHAFPDVRFDHAQIRRQRFDAVFISHFHDDHCSLDSLDLIERATPIYLYCLFDELFAMLRALGFTSVHRLHTNQPVQVGECQVIPREALDADVDSLFQVKAGGMNVLNVVDAWIDPHALALLARQGQWDMVLWPFQTMREIAVLAPTRADPAPEHLPEDWIEQLTLLAPRFVVPSSCQFVQEPWSWYNHALFPITYRQFQQEVEAALPQARVVRLNPSVSILLDADGVHPAPPLAWVLPVGEQDIDYKFDPTLVAPPTADIARHFRALTAPETQTLVDYCSTGLARKYAAMELPEESYFEHPRNWRLSLFDHAGAVRHFYYRVQGDTICLLDHAPHELGWTTEVAMTKLYAALTQGESLTSMYMRINDVVFSPAIEAQVAAADIVDDPLIRCLFDEAFGSYQAAQLCRLQGRAEVAGPIL